ncbi:cystathionine gamma-synthase [Paxillus involutus ATCC 200175]|uniref:Cystathionine gamma-synthase n=1 Tax=Paxillus involutus ATCC 200175 TaxID=664439 RepID=A0A0C9SWQ7_PAXIN|nr:cystathionine gamma-synthase [Paxillus involutus ATCC 200175]
MTTTIALGDIPLGQPLPPTPHALCMSLPNWNQVVGLAEEEKTIMDAIVTGYPRTFIHHSLQKLIDICEQKFGHVGETCLIFPSRRSVELCRDFILRQAALANISAKVRTLQYPIHCGDSSSLDPNVPMSDTCSCLSEFHLAFFPNEVYEIARRFWKLHGLGISSRRAEHYLSFIETTQVKVSRSSPLRVRLLKSAQPQLPSPEEQNCCSFTAKEGAQAKIELRKRIAGYLVYPDADNCQGSSGTYSSVSESGSRINGEVVHRVTEEEVFLFPCGMAAIFNVHQLLLEVRAGQPSKSVVFGFPYMDTLKIAKTLGLGADFFGQGLDSDIDDLERMLAQGSTTNESSPPIFALITEFPSNPLLRVVNLPRLRALANKFNFLLVIDETVGSFANVNVLPFADIVITSLSKFMCGLANVGGGSLVLNPNGRHYATLKDRMTYMYEDIYFYGDAIVMERNSRDFLRRMSIINDNAEAICDFLHPRTIAGGAPSDFAVINQVLYPKYTSPTSYSRFQRPNGGYGGVFSLSFVSVAAAKAFYDALSCAKGPSFGYEFTLAIPYTILGHHDELDWAKEYGLDESLMRISAGVEEKGVLLRCFKVALEAADACVGVHSCSLGM